MTRYFFSPLASQDLEEICKYIGEQDPYAAVLMEKKITTLCRTLANMPEMGRSRNDLSPALRSMPEGKYVIFYIPINDGVHIVRIFHSARDIDSLFSQ